MINHTAVRKLGLLCLWQLGAALLWSQTPCDSLVAYQPAGTWVYQWYDQQQQPTYRLWRQVKRIDSLAAGAEVRIELGVLNDLQDTVYAGNYVVRCDSLGLNFDILARLTPSMLASLNGLELFSEGQGWQLPPQLIPGDTIPATYARIIGRQDGTEVFQLDLGVGEVRVLAQEDLDTPAGPFSCVAMAYELRITTMVRKRFRLRDWWSPGVGIIRRELFDRFGRFYGYCELIRYTGPLN
jgi:hypothetical protein